MESEILLNATDVCYLFQIAVKFLISYDRHQLTVEILAFIFFEYLECRRKKRHCHFGVCLLAVCDDPQTSVKHLLYVVNTQVRKGRCTPVR